jgi:hypothetical protein
LELILKEQTGAMADFVSLAITGEWLRRALMMCEEPQPEGQAVLAEYDSALPLFEQTQPLELDKNISGALMDVTEYSKQDILMRDTNAGEDLLLAIDEVMAVAVAACRVGWIDEDELTRLSQKCIDEMWAAAHRLNDLWEYAEHREYSFCCPDYPQAYHWWECLAQLSPFRIRLAIVVREWAAKDSEGDYKEREWTPEERQTIIDTVLASAKAERGK